MFKHNRIIQKIVALALIAVMLIAMPAFAEDKFDISYASGSDLFTVDVNAEESVAFIETSLSAAARSFDHKYECDAYYSDTKFDTLVIDYFKSSAYPIYRLWILYAGTKHIYATSVAFEFGGKQYVFSDILDPENAFEYSNGDAAEHLLIKFGWDNLQFLGDLESHVNKIMENDNWIDDGIPEDMKIKMVLRGTEVIETELGPGFILDFLALKSIMMTCGGLETGLEKAYATNLKINDIG